MARKAKISGKIQRVGKPPQSSETPKGSSINQKLRRSVDPAIFRRFSSNLKSRELQIVYAQAHQYSLSEWWSPERQKAQQLSHAAALIKYTNETVPMQQLRLAPVVSQFESNLSMELFRELPLMQRREVQEAGAALNSTDLPKGHGSSREIKTTGSSGQPVVVRTTQLSQFYNAAVSLRGHQWFRRDLSGTNVNILVTSDGRERRLATSWAPGSTGRGHVYSNSVPISQLFNWLIEFDPDYLQCHPSVLQEMLYLSANGGERPNKLVDVRTLGEILEPGLRALCTETWGIPVRDNYSSEEFGTLALQCPEYDHLHVMSERVIVEILDDADQPCAPGEIGRIVVTGLLDYATPLIRYELGDRAIAGGPCPCGRGLPVIERVIGRERQNLQLPSGERLFPVLDAEPLLLKTGIKQYQLVQKNLREIELRLVAGRNLQAAEENAIAVHLQRNFGHPFQFHFKYVENIPRGPGGKFQIFKSELPASEEPVPEVGPPNILAILREHAQKRTNHHAIEDGTRTITYGELENLVGQTAANLAAANITSGDRVGVVLADGADHLIILCALARIGAVIFSLNPILPIGVLAESLENMPVKVAIGPQKLSSINDLRVLSVKEVCRHDSQKIIPPAPGGGRPLMLAQSSGTTGTAKYFHHSHRALSDWMDRYVEAQGWHAGERSLCLTPMCFDVARCIALAMLNLGATVVIRRGGSMDQLVALINGKKISYLKLTPSHMRPLLEYAKQKELLFPNLRAMVVGSAPSIQAHRLAARQRLTPNTFEQLGCNEVGLLTFATPADQDAYPQAVGRVINGVEAEVVNEDNQKLPPGEIGLVRYRAPGYLSGYLENVDASAAAFRDGWFYPGDIASLNAAGYLYLKGRADDVINNAGAKFYPIEVETVLLAHPDITEAAVVPLPHPQLGEVAAAGIVSSVPIGSGALKKFCAERLAGFKIPSAFLRLEKLPRNDMGKVLKVDLLKMMRLRSVKLAQR